MSTKEIFYSRKACFLANAPQILLIGSQLNRSKRLKNINKVKIPRQFQGRDFSSKNPLIRFFPKE